MSVPPWWNPHGIVADATALRALSEGSYAQPHPVHRGRIGVELHAQLHRLLSSKPTRAPHNLMNCVNRVWALRGENLALEAQTSLP